MELKTEVHHSNQLKISSRANEVRSSLSQNLQPATKQSCESGASSWLTVIPMTEFGFNLHEQVFHDALCLHYEWSVNCVPSHCVCGMPFSIEHSVAQRVCSPSPDRTESESYQQSCPRKFALVSQWSRHSSPLVVKASNVHHSTNTEDNARLDVCAREFWDKSRATAFFDVRVFNAHAPSNNSLSTTPCYRQHEMEKRRKYERRIIKVEHETFTPLVMSTSGGMGPSASVTVKRLASLLAEKSDIPYSMMTSVIRCRLSFSLLDSSIMCIRGARSYPSEDQLQGTILLL